MYTLQSKIAGLPLLNIRVSRAPKGSGTSCDSRCRVGVSAVGSVEFFFNKANGPDYTPAKALLERAYGDRKDEVWAALVEV